MLNAQMRLATVCAAPRPPNLSHRKVWPKTTSMTSRRSARSAVVGASEPVVEPSCGACESASAGNAGLDALVFAAPPEVRNLRRHVELAADTVADVVADHRAALLGVAVLLTESEDEPGQSEEPGQSRFATPRARVNYSLDFSKMTMCCRGSTPMVSTNFRPSPSWLASRFT